MAYFRGLLVLNFVFMTKTVYNVEIRQECKDCHRDLLVHACDKQRYSGASIPLASSPLELTQDEAL